MLARQDLSLIAPVITTARCRIDIAQGISNSVK